MRILLTSAFVLFAVPDRPDPTSPQAQIIGDWLYAGDGKEVRPLPGPQAFVFRIAATESVWMVNGAPSPTNSFTAKIRFDWSKTPVAIDLMPRHGGSPIHGIVKLDGDRLTLAWPSAGSRPTEFAAGSNVYVHQFTRIKK
jgi:uncharacterized protein (TIGR03067 family)